MAEIYQVYNEHSGTWVKKTAGRILGSQKKKYEDVPVRGNGKPKEEPENDSESDPTESPGKDSDSEDDSWFF